MNNPSRTVAIVQCRMGSTRLPGKVLRRLGQATVLERVVHRLRTSRRLDGIVVATTENDEDDAVDAECHRLGVDCFRGNALDVLDRYARAAEAAGAEHVVRVTADCPFVDATLLDEMLWRYHGSVDSLDYLSNALRRTYPHGLDLEVFSGEALAIADRCGASAAEREHVTPFLYRNPDRFRIANHSQEIDQSDLRWTLDEPNDWKFFLAVVAQLPSPLVSRKEILALIAKDPSLCEINAAVRQKTLADSVASSSQRKAG